MSDSQSEFTVAQLLVDLPAAPAGSWMVVTPSGQVEFWSDAEIEQGLDIDTAAQSPAVDASTLERVVKQMLDLAAPSRARRRSPTKPPPPSPTRKAMLGGVPPQAARVLVALLELGARTGGSAFSFKDLAGVLHKEDIQPAGARLIELVKAKLVSPTAGQMPGKLYYRLTPLGEQAATAMGDAPFRGTDRQLVGSVG